MGKNRKVKNQEYKTSASRPDGWLAKHPGWLALCKKRCTVTLLPLKTYKGKYHPYHVQHLHYKNWGAERYWLDALPMAAWVETSIHWLGLATSVRQQNRQAKAYPTFLLRWLLEYPNPLQWAIHQWARFIALLLFLGVPYQLIRFILFSLQVLVLGALLVALNSH